MSNGIEIQLNNQIQGLPENPEPAAESNVLVIELPTEIIGDENGAIFFNLDWQTRQAESLRQRLATIFADSSATQNQTENLTSATWNDLVNLAREHEDFSRFRRAPENLWQQVRQMSETRVIGDENGNETRTISRFDELAAEMQAKKLSLREFAKTLPPNERTAFEARFQLEKTFGANIFMDDGVTLNEMWQNRFQENSSDASRAAALREVKFLLSGNSRGETLFTAKNTLLPGTNAAVSQNNQFTAAAQTANGNLPGAKLSLPQSPAVFNLNNAAAENKTSGGTTAAQRDGGTVIGGALINGAFASIDNHKFSENEKIRDSQARRNIKGESGNVFAAGATGAMFGAAVGKVIPGAGTAVSGVLGFVSSLVIGVDANQGLRWLGAGNIDFETNDDNASVGNQKLLTSGDSLLPEFNLRLASA